MVWIYIYIWNLRTHSIIIYGAVPYLSGWLQHNDWCMPGAWSCTQHWCRERLLYYLCPCINKDMIKENTNWKNKKKERNWASHVKVLLPQCAVWHWCAVWLFLYKLPQYYTDGQFDLLCRRDLRDPKETIIVMSRSHNMYQLFKPMFHKIQINWQPH